MRRGRCDPNVETGIRLFHGRNSEKRQGRGTLFSKRSMDVPVDEAEDLRKQVNGGRDISDGTGRINFDIVVSKDRGYRVRRNGTR